MFSLRFDQYPASFFLFELLNRSSVTVKVLAVPMKDLPIVEVVEEKNNTGSLF
jgi:hypothetical protein